MSDLKERLHDAVGHLFDLARNRDANLGEKMEAERRLHGLVNSIPDAAEVSTTADACVATDSGEPGRNAEIDRLEREALTHLETCTAIYGSGLAHEPLLAPVKKAIRALAEKAIRALAEAARRRT